MKKTGLLLSLLTLLWYCGAAQTPVQTDLRSFLPAVGRIEAAGYDSHVELRWPAVSGAESYAVYLLRDGQKVAARRDPEPLLPRLRRRTRPQRSLYVPCGGARR